MVYYILAFQLLFILLICNTTFVILTSPVIFLLYKIKRRRKSIERDKEIDIIVEDSSSFYLLKRYLDGFMRYYDCRVSQACVKRGWPIADKKFLESIGVEAERMEPQRGRGRPRKASAINPLESDTNLLNK